MIHLVGVFAKARAYVVQVRTYSRRRRNPEIGWVHSAQFNYDGKMTIEGKRRAARVGDTKRQAEIRALMFAHRLDSGLEYRVLNVTVKQAHKLKTATYKPEGDLKPYRPEFDYDKKCRFHPTTQWIANKRKTDEKLGATALANPIIHAPHPWHKDDPRLARAHAYYLFAQNL